MSEVQHQLNRYYKAATTYKAAIERTGKLRPVGTDFSGKPISYHPSHLTEVYYNRVHHDFRGVTTTLYKDRIPFSALLAPIEYDIYEGSQEYLEPYLLSEEQKSLANEIEFASVPVAELPLSLREFHLHTQVQEINMSPVTYDIKCYKLLEWLFAYDDIASEIPTDY
jgi:hypothetical protein